jgi:hypothetical protein
MRYISGPDDIFAVQHPILALPHAIPDEAQSNKVLHRAGLTGLYLFF